jgi:hypothetical protein
MENGESLLKEEAENAFEALTEIFEKGFTVRRCLRCKGELVVENFGNSCEVWCKNESRKILTSRGI